MQGRLHESVVNLFQLNSTEIQGFLSAKSPTPFHSTRSAVKIVPHAQTKAKGAFDLLTYHETKQLEDIHLVCI